MLNLSDYFLLSQVYHMPLPMTEVPNTTTQASTRLADPPELQISQAHSLPGSIQLFTSDRASQAPLLVTSYSLPPHQPLNLSGSTSGPSAVYLTGNQSSSILHQQHQHHTLHGYELRLPGQGDGRQGGENGRGYSMHGMGSGTFLAPREGGVLSSLLDANRQQ